MIALLRVRVRHAVVGHHGNESCSRIRLSKLYCCCGAQIRRYTYVNLCAR